MKCWTFREGKITEGIELVEVPKWGTVVYLGEKGKGRRCEKVMLGRTQRPVVVEGRLMDAVPKTITQHRGSPEERQMVILIQGEPEDARQLVRISTKACYARLSIGAWRTVKGSPELIAAGHGAHGEAGRVGTWDDGLVILSSGDVLRIKPEGGKQTQPYALICEGTMLECLPFADYEQRVASN